VTIELASPEVLPERRFGGGGVVAMLAGEGRLASKCAFHDLQVDASQRRLCGIDIGSRRFVFGAERMTELSGSPLTEGEGGGGGERQRLPSPAA
jgi:hypothetical protein